MYKASKRTIDSDGDTDMEEAHINKKDGSQCSEEEEQVGIQLEELVPDHLDFHITLENPPPVVASSNGNIVIPKPKDNATTTGSSWPIGKYIE